MSIIFRPIGSLDTNTDPSILPENREGNDIVSGAMKRCKNLNMDRIGMLSARNGTSKLNDSASLISAAISLIVEQGGYRYVFASGEIYRNESLISGVQCDTPTFDPDGGAYAAQQSVTIETTTAAADIFYTLDGSTPTEGSIPYTTEITVPFFTTLKAIAVRSGFSDSEVKSAYYGATSIDLNTEGGDDLVSETNTDDIIGEGTS